MDRITEYTLSRGAGEALSYIGFAIGAVILFGLWDYPMIKIGKSLCTCKLTPCHCNDSSRNLIQINYE